MRATFRPVLIALAAVLLVAGCGGGDEPAAPQVKTVTEKEKQNPSGGLSDNQVDQAVAQCRQTIETQGSRLGRDVQKDLERICEQAAKGDENAVRKAAKRVCEETISDSLPSGPLRDQALASCQQATRRP